MSNLAPIKTGFTFDEYINLPEYDQPWLLEPFIPIGGTGLLAGAPKSRKSYLVLQLAIDLAHGRPWLGFASNPCRVFYIQLDTPRSLWKLRMRRLKKQGIEVAPEAMERLILADIETVPQPFDIKQPVCQEWLRARVLEHKPDLIILDTMSKAHSADEDNRTEMEQVMGQLHGSVKPAALLMVTHTRKAKSDYDGGVVNEIRGSSAVMGGVDILMRLMRPTKKRPTHLLEYEGRQTENGAIELTSLKNLLFKSDPEVHWPRLLHATLAEEHPNRSAAGRALQERAAAIGIHKSEDTCRKAIERAEND